MTPEEGVHRLDGEPLRREDAARISSHHPLRLASPVDAAAPVESGDIVEVSPPEALRIGDIVVYERDGVCRLARLVDHRDGRWVARDEPDGASRPLEPGDVVGVVTLVEKGDLLLELRRGRWASIGRLLASLPPVAARWGHPLALLERLRRPLFPPLFLGTPEELLARLVRTYEAEGPLLMREDGLASEERALLGRDLRPGMRLLDIGCGPGREAIGFAHEGLAVTAVDIVPAMVHLARSRARAAGVSVTFEVADPLTFDAAPGSFDAVYLSPGVYAHIPGGARRIETLRRLGRLLAPGGFVVLRLVLFEPFPLVSRARLVDLLRRLGRSCGVRRVSEPGDHYHRGYGLARAPGSFRYLRRFTGPDAVIVEVLEAGFEISRRLEDSPTWIIRPRV